MAVAESTTALEVVDREIVTASHAGDKIALEILYRWYAGRLQRLCLARLGDATEAEDAAHETILKAYAALPRFHNERKLWPWLATIAVNVCTDIQRSRKFSGSQPLEEQVGEDIDEAVNTRARAEIVSAALTELPIRYRTLVYLKDFGGLSYDQIAQRLGMSVSSVRSRLLRARNSLRESIKKVADQRGQWPLPIALPWLRQLDHTVVATIANVAAAVALIALSPPPVASSGSTAAPESRAPMAPQSTSNPDASTQSRQTQTSTKPNKPPALRIESPKTSAELDGKTDSETWVEAGPVRISCDRNSDRGPVSAAARDALCPVLSNPS